MLAKSQLSSSLRQPSSVYQATRIESCTFGALQDQPWAGELQHGEGSCVHSFDDLKRILETMHLRGRGVGSGASDSDVEEIVGCGSRATKRLRSNTRLFCVWFIPMFAISRLTDNSWRERISSWLRQQQRPMQASERQCPRHRSPSTFLRQRVGFPLSIFE